jgi:hypothetical protein
MDTDAKIVKIFENAAKEFIDMQKSISKSTNSYEFEKQFKKKIHQFGQIVFQEMIGEEKVNKNDRIKQFTSFGEITMNKRHPLAVLPGGFKISPYLQEQMCRSGSHMTFEEASDDLNELLGIETNAKQIERLCHYYGENLNTIDWREAYSDGIQLRIPFHRRPYVLLDGSMLLTRDKEQAWKEVKLCRMFYDTDRVESVSKNRNMITESRYVAHLGGHKQFFEKVSEIIPSGYTPVFIGDGAKWILVLCTKYAVWNWVEDHYPKSIQILDFYHCKEHLYSFAKEYFTEKEAEKWVEAGMEKLKNEKVEELLTELEKLPVKNKNLDKSRNKLLSYLTNNKKRINYGKYIRDGLLIGSGAIESANREVIQKRMKLSGQRWTIRGAQQMLNMRTCYKSNKKHVVKNLIISDYYRNCA